MKVTVRKHPPVSSESCSLWKPHSEAEQELQLYWANIQHWGSASKSDEQSCHQAEHLNLLSFHLLSLLPVL